MPMETEHLGRLIFGPIRLPEDSEVITDGEEEIFYIYTQWQGAASTAEAHGLGYINSTSDVLELSFDLVPPEAQAPAAPTYPEAKRKRHGRTAGGTTTKRSSTKNVAAGKLPERVEVQLAQDVTALRSRKGDTGSVVWHASVAFARVVLQQHRFPIPDSTFIDYELLKSSRVLELGAGTGILSILLGPLCERYTVTDHPSMIPLIQKNVTNNSSNAIVEPLDWISVHSTLSSQRRRQFPVDEESDPPFDLILVVDCIYHPTLIPPLISTIDHYATPEKTAVLVVSELRSEEVLREFINTWLALPGWSVWHVGGELLGDKRYVLWMGWKHRVDDSDLSTKASS